MFQAHFMDMDLEMYDEATDTPCVVKTAALNEELGQALLFRHTWTSIVKYRDTHAVCIETYMLSTYVDIYRKV